MGEGDRQYKDTLIVFSVLGRAQWHSQSNTGPTRQAGPAEFHRKRKRYAQFEGGWGMPQYVAVSSTQHGNMQHALFSHLAHKSPPKLALGTHYRRLLYFSHFRPWEVLNANVRPRENRDPRTLNPKP